MSASIGVILASVRQGRRGEAFANWIFGLLSQRSEVKAELLDLRDWPLPPYAEPALVPTAELAYAEGSLAARWADRIRSLDGFIVVTPEYNRGYPGQLKNALDTLYTAWNYKPIAFVGYGGFASGARSVAQLYQVAIELRMVPLRDEVNISLINLAVDERGFPAAELHKKKAATLLNELVWMTRLLKDGRERHPR